MTNYEAVSLCINDLGKIEGRLKALRDNCGKESQAEINKALQHITGLYQPLHNIDKALEKDGTGAADL
jgi:hypothetical protein